MKNRVLLFLITLMMTISSSFANTLKETEQEETVSITSTELRETNLIFVEHAKLLEENSLLMEQIENYKEDNELLLKASGIKSEQIENYQAMNSLYSQQVKDLQNEIKKKNRTILGLEIGGVTVTVGLLLLLIFK